MKDGPYFVTRRELDFDQEEKWFESGDERTFEEFLDEDVIVGRGFGFLLKKGLALDKKSG